MKQLELRKKMHGIASNTLDRQEKISYNIIERENIRKGLFKS